MHVYTHTQCAYKYTYTHNIHVYMTHIPLSVLMPAPVMHTIPRPLLQPLMNCDWMCACVFMCMHTYIHTFMHAYIHTHNICRYTQYYHSIIWWTAILCVQVYAYVHACMHMHTYTHTPTPTHTHTHTHTLSLSRSNVHTILRPLWHPLMNYDCMCACACMCMNTYMHACMHKHTNTQADTQTRTRTHKHARTHPCTDTCMHAHTHTNKHIKYIFSYNIPPLFTSAFHKLHYGMHVCVITQDTCTHALKNNRYSETIVLGRTWTWSKYIFFPKCANIIREIKQ